MRSTRRSVLLAMGAWSFAAYGEGASGLLKFRGSMERYARKYNELLGSLESAKDSTDKNRRGKLESYYRDVIEGYLIQGRDPNGDGAISTKIGAFNSRLMDLERGLDTESLSVAKEANKRNSTDAYLASNIPSCSPIRARIKKARSKMGNAANTLMGAMTPSDLSIRDISNGSIPKINLSRSEWGDFNEGADEYGTAFDELASCCRQQLSTLKGQPTEAKVTETCDKIDQKREELAKIGNEFDFAPRSVPDPIRDGIPAADVQLMLEAGLGNQLAAIRKNKEDHGYQSEMHLWGDASIACDDAARNGQKSTNPMRDAFLKLGVCGARELGMFYSATSTRLTTYKAVSGILDGINFPGVLECGQSSKAAYDLMRPDDPNIIYKKWGLEQLANPQYIAEMRVMRTIPRPFAIVTGPNGEVITPGGVIGGNSTSGQGVVVAASRSGGLDSSRRTNTRTTDNSYLDPTRNSGRVASLFNSEYGVSRGAALSRGARTLAANVRNGRQAQSSAQQLRSGASKTRALADTMVRNNRALGSGDSRRRLASASAAQTRTQVVRAATAQTTRALASDNLRHLGRTPTTSTGTKTSTSTPTTSTTNSTSTTSTRSPVKGTGGSATQIAANKQQMSQARMTQLVQMYAKNMESARAAGNKLLVDIDAKIRERDQAIEKVMAEIVEAAPNDQYKIMSRLRAKTLRMDKELSALKIQYDVYGGAVQEQGAMIDTLIRFGGQPVAGSNLRPGSYPANFPRYPTGAKFEMPKFLQKGWFKFLNPIEEAQAAARYLGDFETEAEWNKAFDAFSKDYENYVAFKEATERDAQKALVRAMSDYSRSVTEATARDTDGEVLTIMDIFTESVEEEARDLVQASTTGAMPLPSDVLTSLRAAQEDAAGAQNALKELAFQYRDSYPTSYENNPEAWWGFVPAHIFE